VPEQPQRVEPLLGRELRPVPARDRQLDALGGQRPRCGHERGEVLARGVGGDAEHVRPLQPERAAGAGGVRLRREAAVHAARHDRHACRIDPEQVHELRARERRHGHDPTRAGRQHGKQAPLPGRVDAGVPAGMAQRGRVVEHEHRAPRDRRGKIGRAQQQRGAQPGGARRQDELLPRVASPVHQPRRWAQDGVAAGSQRRQPRGELARPPLHPAQLGARGGAGVDGDRRRQGA
jgi:hypothetical protein